MSKEYPTRYKGLGYRTFFFNRRDYRRYWTGTIVLGIVILSFIVAIVMGAISLKSLSSYIGLAFIAGLVLLIVGSILRNVRSHSGGHGWEV